MRKDLERAFTYLTPLKPPADLFEKIIGRIQKERRISNLKRRIIIFSAGLISSLTTFVPALKIAKTEVIDSDFWQFFSLVFSDFKEVTTYWQNFAMALLERLPVVGLGLLLVCFFVLVVILRLLFRDIKLLLITKEV